jgi:hypothetical protein
VTNCRTSTQVAIVGYSRTLIGFCVAIGRYRQLFRDIAPSTPHYNQLFHSSLVSLPVTSDPTVENYWKIQCYLRGRTLRLLGHEHLLSFSDSLTRTKTLLPTYMRLFHLCMMHI